MPHVTFIHGISNKPPADDLMRIWCDALAEAVEPLPLGDLGVTTSLVYWADLFYERPDDNLAGYESMPVPIEDAGTDDIPRVQPRNAEEDAFLERLEAKTMMVPGAGLSPAELPPPPDEATGRLERIPVPWFIKKRFLDVYLRDVHHYLFDAQFGPPGKPAVPIQQTIRKRFVEVVAARPGSGPHVVVSHSLGTVIAYDCLKRVADCAGVDGLITLGSPLGLDEIQDRLQPGWSREDGYPHAKLSGDWVNVFDHLDPVCGFDPFIANDYRQAGAEIVTDIAVRNPGIWRHSATSYLRQPAFCAALRRTLNLKG